MTLSAPHINLLLKSLTFHFVFLVTDDMRVEPPVSAMMEEPGKCKVQNLTCVEFPTTKQCQGISFGGCICKYICTLGRSALVLCWSLASLEPTRGHGFFSKKWGFPQKNQFRPKSARSASKEFFPNFRLDHARKWILSSAAFPGCSPPARYPEIAISPRQYDNRVV